MTRTSRIALLSLTALVAACLFSVALFAQNASANITPTLTATYADGGSAGTHSNYTQALTFNNSGDNVQSGEDVRNLAFDYPAGLIGDPNAVPAANRCNFTNAANTTAIDYNGGTAGSGTPGDVSPSSGSPDYKVCGTSDPNSQVGSITVSVTAIATVLFIPVTCNVTLTGGIYLLQNRPTANPEVPTYLGIHVEGSAGGICALGGTSTMDMTAKITLRPTDNGLRVVVVDDLPRVVGTAVDANTEIRLDTVSQTINGMAPSGKPFLTEPTRCDAWSTKAYARGWVSNGNVDSDVNPVDAVNEMKADTKSTTPNCGSLIPAAPTFSLANSPSTATQAGAPTGLRATLTNPVPTGNTKQPAYAREFSLALPVGYKINPTIANRLGGVGGGCTEAQFLVAAPGTPVSDAVPTCPATSEIGTVAVTVPEITGDLVGKLYLGEPRAGDEAAGIYRLYIQAARGGVSTKFQGTATADAGTGQVTVSIKNISSFNAAGGLPQFNYSKFDMDFNSASAGIGLDPAGLPISNPVASPNAARQMLLNPQVCGAYAPVVTVKPWTSPNQGDITPTVAALNVTAGTNGSCNFLGFNPTVAAKLRNTTDTADLTDAGSHPDLTITATRPDRMDNIRDLVIDFPSGFAGSASVVTPANLCTAGQASSNTCPAASKVGTVQVLTGGGTDTAALNGSIYMATTQTGDTATLAVVVPAQVGPFNLGNVVLTTHMTIPSGSSFSLRASTMSMPQSILGIPILYRSIAFKLNGTVNAQSFLTVPSTCGQNLNFLTSITSNGDAPGTAGTGVVSTVTPSASAGTVTNCAAAQGFAPTVSIDKSDGATGTYQAGAQTGINVTLNSPVTTPPQSTIKKVDMTFPSGMEINPAFAASRVACPTATINAITNASDGCATGFASSLIGSVSVNTPLLASAVPGLVYLETPGATRDTRYKIALVLFMPGGVQIVHGSTTIDSGVAGSTAAVGATGLTNTGTGQIRAVFDGLPDVPWTSMVLKFSDASRPQMFVNPPSCGAKTWATIISPTNTSKTAVNATPGYTTTDSNCAAVNSAWAPTFSVTTNKTAAGDHPNVSMTVTRPDLNQQLRDVVFDLPVGFTGAPAATASTCTQASADAATCASTAPASSVGSVSVKIGSGSTPATVTGGIYNTVAPSTAPAKLTAVVPVTIGPFALGSMSVPVDVSMNDDYSLRASVLNLPSRYEGIAVRYQELKVSLNGLTTDNKPFLTNPSTCPGTPANFTASVTSATPTTTALTAAYPVTGCGNFTASPNGPGIAVTGLSTAQQTPTGMNVNVTNTLSTAVINPTIKRVQLAFPAGFTLNPAIGNNGANTTCAAGNFSVNAAPTCPTQSKIGSVSLLTPLLKNTALGAPVDGSWPGSVYLTTPGSARETRYQIKIVIPIPGKYIVISGSATADAGAIGAVGPTGLTDTGTGVVSADFNNLPDLGFTGMSMTFDASSSGHQLIVTPSSQLTGVNVVGTVSPNTGGTAVAQNSAYSGAAATQTFNPTFSASLSSVAAGASPTLTVGVTSAGTNVKQLRNFNMHLPTGLVANGSAVSRCSQANANAANCAVGDSVGTITTVIGPSASENYSLNGTLYNVVPSNNEPARLQAVVPVNVGPYALGSLTIPVTTSMRSDNGIDTLTTLPRRYEGIDVYVRSLSLAINAPNYLINPSACGAVPFTADFIAGDGGTVSGVTASPAQTIGSCARNYGTAPTLAVTPTTTETAKPTGLTFTLGSTIANPTTQSVAMTFPQGIEFNPAGAAAMGAAGSCPLATVQTNAAACPALSIIGSTTLTTPLLANPVLGTVYLETPGTTATTRYKANIALNLPGRAQPLVIQGSIQVNGSTTIPVNGTGSTDATGTATGQITANFTGIPDLGFTSMVVALVPQAPNASNAPLFVNPTSCTTSTGFSATFTPFGTGSPATANASYNTDNTNCGTGSTFTPGFSFTPGTATPAAHPDLTLSFTRPDFNRSIRSLTVSLPTGLVAATANAGTPCDIPTATAGNCATTPIGTADTTFGSGSTASASGTVYNVSPINSNEPARFQAIMPVTVGPFNLGKLSVPISTSLRSDLGIDASATLPVRYEGIAVRLRTLNIKLLGSVGSSPVKNFLTMPSNCAASSIGWSMTSDGVSPSTAANTSALNIAGAGCSTTFPTAPTMTVTPTSGSSTLAAEPVNLTFGIHSDANNPTIKRVGLTFPSGMEINPGFANNAAANALTCPTATINAITTTDTCATGFPLSKLATVTMVTPLLPNNPSGAVYLESPGSTEASRYRVVMVIQLPGRMLVVRGSIDVPGDSTIPTGGTGVVGGSGGPITADFNNIPDLGFTDLTLAFNSTKPLVVNPETCTAGSFSGDFYPWSSGIKTTVTSAWTSTTCAAPTPFDPSFSVQVAGGTSTAAASHPNLTLSVARADKSKALSGMTISLPPGLVANTGQVASCLSADVAAVTCATNAQYSQVGTFSASFGSGTQVNDPYSLSNGKLFQTVPQSPSEPVRFQAVLPVVVGPFDLGNLSIPVSSSLRSDFGIDITTNLPTRYEGISVRMRTMSIAMNGTVSTGPSSTTSYIVAPSKCQTNTVSAAFTAADASSDTNNGNNSSTFTTTGCTTTAPAYAPTVSMTNSPTSAGNPTAVGLTFNVPADNSTTSQVVTKFPAGMELNPGAANDLTACTSFDPITGPSCPNSSLLGSVTLNTPLLPNAQTGSIYVESPGNTASTRYKLVLAIQLPGRWLIIHGGALVAGTSDIPTSSTGAIGSTADTGVANGEVTATFPGLPDLGFSSLVVQFKNSGAGANLFVNPKTCSTTNVLTATMTPTNTAMSPVAKTTNFTTAGGTCGTTGFAPTFSGTLNPSPAASVSNPDINLSVANPLGTQELRNLAFTLPTGLVANTTAVTQCTPAQASAAACPAGTMVGSATTSIGSSDTAVDALPVAGTIYNATPSAGEVARLQVVLPVTAGPFNFGNLSIPVPVTLNPDMSVTASAALPSRYEGVAVRIRAMAMTVLGSPNGNKFVVAPSKCATSAMSARLTSDTGTVSTVVSPSSYTINGCPKNFTTTPAFSVTPSTTVRGAPVNLGFSVTSAATNPTVGRIQMTLPSGMEINPAFGNNLSACATGTIDSGGSSCPVASRVGTVSLTTPLLAGSYTGNVYLEEPGNIASTRYKLAIVVNLPGQPLIVRGAIAVDGTSNIPTASTGATGSIDSGTNPIVADFNNIPDLAFSNLTVNFSSTNPMLINPTSCSSNSFQAQFTPNSGGTTGSQTASYSTTPVGCQTDFTPNFTATTTAGSSIAAGTVQSASNPGLQLHVDRPADGGTFQNYLRDFNLQLPVGMLASTTATATTCTQPNAAAGNCTAAQRVGTFSTSIGNGTGNGSSTDTTHLYLNGGIYNVTPSGTEVARLAAITPVLVGPYNLGNLVLPITTALRSSDMGVNTFTQIPRRYEGIAVRVKALDITLNGWIPATNKPFMVWPSRCAANTITANMTSNVGESATGTGTITTNSACSAGFGTTPTLATSANPTTTSKPTGLGLTVGSAASNPTIKRVQMTMPTGMSINPAAGNSGNSLTCATADINAGGSACPALSQQGTVTLNTPLLQAPATGKVFLETPTDMTPANRYKLAIVVDLPGSTDLILHGSVGLAGSTGITGGTGATDSGTGVITADFNNIPDLGFTSLDISFATGARALLTNADSCGTQTVAAKITPTTGGADANVSGTYTTTGTGTGCASTETFNPTFTVNPSPVAGTSTVSGANTDLNIDVTTGITNDYLRNFNLKLPAGLVAATAATTTRCSQAQENAATCTSASKVGTIDTQLGTGAEKLPLSGTIYNVDPAANEPAHLAAIIPVQVGPYNLGKLSIPVSTSLRSSDYGVDTTTQIPYRYEGIAVKIASMSLKLLGTVDQGTVPTGDDAGFIKNPSQCDPAGTARPFQAVISTLGGSSVTKSANYPVTGCPRNFSPNPTLTVSNTTNQTAVPTGMTLQFDSSASNPTIGSVVTRMPLGMTLNPAVANLNGGINVCSTATIEAIKLNPNATPCPAASKVGDVSLITPLLPGTKTGAVYLEEPGNTAATRYQLVMIVDLPGTKLVLRGSTTVSGSSDIPTNATSATGATNSGDGHIVATFGSIPDLGFTQLKIAFSGGPDALFTNSETAGTQTVEADIAPQSGGSTITANGTFSTVYGGSGSLASELFTPTFDATFSTTDAAANPDVTIDVTRADYTQQIKEFDLHLPPGLVANTVLTPRCTQALADKGACDPDSVVGSVTTNIGTGSDTLTMPGKLYNVIPDPSEPARLAVVIPVKVGPYNLGNLSLPVTTQIVTGSSASDLSINTHTVLPASYEGVPVRVRQLQIKLAGMADQGTPGNTADDKPFMINPSQCISHDLEALMKAPSGDASTGTESFTTTNCANAQYNPAITAALSTTQRGKPVGLDLGFQFSGNSSSTKKIVTTFPSGMAINPGVGNYGTGMTCDDADVQAGGANCPGTYVTDPDGLGPIDVGDVCVQSDSGCHISSNLGSVTLNTPLLPTTQSGALYLLPPVGNQASTRYRLGLFVDLPGTGDLYTTGSVTVDGSSDVTGGTGAVDTGDGQVKATFDNLPDLQFNDLTIHFKTTGASDHALLTNPNTCGTFTIEAEMFPWARPTTSEAATTDFTTTDNVASCAHTQSSGVTAELGAAGPDFNNPASPVYYAGSSQPVTLTVNRPDSDKSIESVKILLPPGLVGSADAAPTCLQADADAGNCGSTEPGSAIGTVSLQIGDSSDTYEITGALYNTVAPSNRPAKFTFIADVNVGPFAFGKVIVPVGVNLDPNDYSLFAETDPMPQVFEGIPVRINQMKIALVGTADQGTPSTADDKVFMSNPRSCSTTLNVRAVITAPDSSTQNVTAPLAGPFTNCGSLNLNANTVTIENEPIAPETGHGAEHPTGLNVQVHQDENLATQATLKNLKLDLPGFRLSAPAANGLDDCSAAQLDAQTCPEASRVGTAWIDTSLLPKNQTSPDGPGSHSLWGAVYLETPGTAPDGSDRYKLAIQLTGKTLITIRGIAHVNETTGEISTTFDDLPDIPFTDFRVELTGYKKVTGTGPSQTTTYFPLLLNPAGVVGSASSVTGNANLTPHSGTPAVDRPSTLPVDSAPVKTFTPTSTSNISPLTSGGHPTANFVIARGDNQEDIKDVGMQLPAGFLGSAAAVPLCPLSSAAAGTCNDLSKVGDVTAKIGQYGQTLTLPGKVYLTAGVGGDIAGMSIKVPAKAGPYDLGDFITQGRIQIRPSDHGITVNFADVPKLFKGVPTHIQNMDITLPGEPNGPEKPFLYNASDCSPFSIITTLTPYVGAAASDSDAYQATGCPTRQFRPGMSFNATTPGDEKTAPAWTIKMHTDKGDSTLKSTTVVLPSVMTVNVAGLGDACQPDQVTSRTCPATSKIGTVTVETPLLPTPVNGTVYMAKSISGQSLPDLLIDIPAPIDMQIRGANSFLSNGNAASQIKSTFSNLPDLIWSDLTMNITGGPKGILGLRGNGTCGSASSTFASHSGQSMSGEAEVIGLEGYCANLIDQCANPTVKVSTKGAKKKGNKKATTSLSFSTANNCKAIQSVRVSYPKGTKINKKLIKWKKTKNKKQAKAYKKNLKNLTGKAGSKSLTAKDFAASGSNGLKFKSPFPADTRSFSIKTKNSSLLPSYKTFCGDVTKKKYKNAKKYKAALKKCQKKNVTFTFEVTNVGGTAYRFNYTAPAGSKFFK